MSLYLPARWVDLSPSFFSLSIRSVFPFSFYLLYSGVSTIKHVNCWSVLQMFCMENSSFRKINHLVPTQILTNDYFQQYNCSNCSFHVAESELAEPSVFNLFSFDLFSKLFFLNTNALWDIILKKIGPDRMSNHITHISTRLCLTVLLHS